MSYIVFFALLTVVCVGLLVLTQRQLTRARSYDPSVAAGVRASEGTLQWRRAVLVLCSLAAVGGLIAMTSAHDQETWTDGEVLGVARDAADTLNGSEAVSSPDSAVNDAVGRAMADADGPGLLSTEPTGQDDADDDSGYGESDDEDGGGDTSYVISDHGRHAACLTVTSSAGPGVLVPVPDLGDPGGSTSSSIDTYDLSATATAGAC
ncbi:hypothetical protein [Streptomyces sp. DW26H14]|uniref:hypothetical protein n=1 Tax=Streptomyces sp. DW26H14 TaxID=3435395 RepID=UPI00403DF6AD